MKELNDSSELKDGYYWLHEKTSGWEIYYWRSQYKEWRYSRDGQTINDYCQITHIVPEPIPSPPPVS